MGYSKERMNEYLQQRSKKLIKECIDILGGVCVVCNTTENLQFDHIDRTTKEFEISKARSVSKSRLLLELKKCQLLCESCHLKKSKKCGDLPTAVHGSLGMHRDHNCRCDICRAAYNSYMRTYKRKWRKLKKLESR